MTATRLMRQAVEQVRAVGLGQPRLSASYVEGLERQVRYWASEASQHPERVNPVESTTATTKADP
jgi:hypothetical protein